MHDDVPILYLIFSRWDENAFDPKYESLPLSEFRPMLERILQR